MASVEQEQPYQTEIVNNENYEEEPSSPKIIIGASATVASTNTLPEESQEIHHHPSSLNKDSNNNNNAPSTGIWKFLDELIILEKPVLDSDPVQQRAHLHDATSPTAQQDPQRQLQLHQNQLEQPTETVKSILAEFAPLALKSCATQALQFVNQAIAVMLVSHMLGTTALAPFGVAISFFNVCSASVLVSLTVAMETLASQAYGHNKHGPEVGQHVQFNLSILYALNVPLIAFFLYCSPILQVLFGPDLAPGIAEFLRAAPFYLCMFSTRAVVNRSFLAEKRAHIPMRGMIITTCTFPIYAYFMVPHGIAYACYALGLAPLVHVTCMLIMGYFDKTCFLHRVSWQPTDIVKLWTMHRLREFMVLAIPTAGGVLLMWWVQEVLVWIGAQMTVDKVAALSIILNLTMIMFVEMLGYSMATASVVGNRLGANEAANAKAAARVCLVFGVALCCVNALWALIFGKLIFRLYTHDDAVIDLLVSVLPIICLFHLAEGTQIAMNGVFRGVAQQRQTVLVVFVAMWLFAVPAMYLDAIVFHKSIQGLMLCFTAGFALQVPWSAWLIHKWDWKVLANNAHERRMKSAAQHHHHNHLQPLANVVPNQAELQNTNNNKGNHHDNQTGKHAEIINDEVELNPNK